MDIANYVIELLGQLGEVNVPGLGNFKLHKIKGYYNDSEGRFYPPANDVRFSSNYADDDILAEYIAEKKKISLASSKYFTEKYVNNLKQDAIQKDVPLAGLGSMRFSVHEISFKSAGMLFNGPEFFGYPQVELKKLGNTSFMHQMEALMKEPKDEPLPVPVFAGELPEESELPVDQHDEPGSISAEEPPKEAEATVLQHDEAMLAVVEEHVKESELPVIQTNESDALPVKEPEQEPGSPVLLQEELPAIDLPEEQREETKLPLAQAEETTLHEAAQEELESDAEPPAFNYEETAPVVLPYEPVKEPEPAEFDLESYLQELEASAGIITPEADKVQAEAETTTTERAVDSSESEPEAVIPASETVILAPEASPVTEPQLPEPMMDVTLPERAEEPYEPGLEMQEVTRGTVPIQPQPEVDKPPGIPLIAAIPQAEEDFVFDGKGYDNVDNKRKNKNSYAWLWITLVIILLVGGGGYAWFRQRQLASKMIKANAAPVHLKALVKIDATKTPPADSLKNSAQTAVIEDTTQKAVTAPVNSGAIDSTKIRYELVGVSVPTIAAANRCVVNYKSLGIADAHVLIPGPGMGRLIKVSLGTFSVRLDAIHKKRELLKTGNIREITILKINPKK